MDRSANVIRFLVVAVIALSALAAPSASRAQASFVPATGASDLREALFSAQSALLQGDAAAAQAAIQQATALSAPMVDAFGPESGEGKALTAGLADVSAAIAAGDAAGV